MATYQFSVITSPEAAGYMASRDDLRFDGIANITATSVTASDSYLIRLASGASVQLGGGASGDRLTLPDGSILGLPGSGEETVAGGSAGDHLYGGIGFDALSGLAGGDVLEGGTGNDTLTGGSGADTLTGGAGIDNFVFGPGDSGVAQGQVDTITDWDPGFEKLAFSTSFSSPYAEATETTYAAALATANGQIASGAADVVAVRVGNEVFVFADTRNDNGTADDAIRLVGKGLDQIAVANIVGGSGPPPATRTGTGGTPTPPGVDRSGPDTLTAPSSGGTLSGGAGDDFLNGSRDRDLLDGGDGNDTIVANGGHDTIVAGSGNDIIDITDSYGDTTLTLGSGADLVRITGFQQFENEIPRILDFTWNEDGIRFAYVMGGKYGEGTAASFDAAKALAQRMGSDGYRIVAIQVDTDVFVFGHWTSNVRFDSAIRLVNRTLDDIAGANVGLFSNPTYTEPTAAPAAPARVTSGVVTLAGNMDGPDVGVLQAKNVGEVTDTRIVLDGPGLDIVLTGSNFSTDATRTTLYGDVTGFALGSASLNLTATMAPKALGGIVDAIDLKNTAQLLNYVLSGSDQISGSAGADLIRASTGNDLILGQGGADTIYAGFGDDVVYATALGVAGSAQTYLRGDDGNDWIAGADGFDDINGNIGADTLSGGAGDDWVVGGKDSDRLFGDAGNDLVYGNIGSDNCFGGEGADTVRGGQDNDAVFGGAGADFLSGDRGNDTLIGGAGADIFSSFVGNDTDRIEDFNFAEGDRVMVPAGTQWTFEQVGPELIVNLVGGGRIVMVGMTQANLPEGWIFGA